MRRAPLLSALKSSASKRKPDRFLPPAEISFSPTQLDTSKIRAQSRHNQKTFVQAFGRGLFVLEALNRYNGATANELAHATAIDRGIVYRLLETLRMLDYIERDPESGGYWVKAPVTGLSGGWASENWISSFARERINELGANVSWPISLTVPGGNSMVLRICTDQSTPFTFRKMPVGLRMSMPHTASGRIYLSSLDAHKRQSLIQLILQSSPFAEDTSLPSAARLEAAFVKINKAGHAIQQIPNITSIAVPVKRDDVPLGSLCLRYYTTAMSQRTAIDRYVDKLHATARDISEEN